MKTEDLYKVASDTGYLPYYLIPEGYTFQTFTWTSTGPGGHHYMSNYLTKGFDGMSHYRDGVPFNFENDCELVRQITHENTDT